MEKVLNNQYKLDKTNKQNRDEIIENYKHLIPNLSNYVYDDLTKVDISHIGERIDYKNPYITYQHLLKSVIDIRNNSFKIDSSTNVLAQSDNKYCAEEKNMLKILLNKGYSFEQACIEMEKIYGLGIISNMDYYKFGFKEYFFMFSEIGLKSYFSYKMFRLTLKFFKKI